jgi:hypothetical protein
MGADGDTAPGTSARRHNAGNQTNCCEGLPPGSDGKRVDNFKKLV